MVQRFSCRLLAVSLLLLFYFPLSFAQSPAQTRICARYGESARCQQLFSEFFVQRLILMGKSTGLDTFEGDLGTLEIRLAPRAILQQIKTNLRATASEAAQTALQTISTSSATNQNGGAPTAAGSTNLVSKPTTTDFISMAAESGAFTDTLNGTTMTIQANGLGLTKYFANQPVFQRWESKYADFIQPLTFTITNEGEYARGRADPFY